MTPTPQGDLFGGALPPAPMSAFSAFHRESRQREAEAVRRGVTRQIGAERRARYEFTHDSLRGRA